MAENQIALELNPNLVEAMAWSGFLHGYNGHPELAIEPLRRAKAQSPKDRLRWAWSLWFGGTYLLMAEYEDAILWLERSIAINPMFWMSFALLAAAYANAGDMINAVRAKAQFEEVYRGEDLDFRRYSSNTTYIQMTEKSIFTGWRKVGIAIARTSSF
jgi:tetratricopeptide (TPR) repeat protein